MKNRQKVKIATRLLKSEDKKREFLTHIFKPNEPVQLDLFVKHPYQLIEEMVKEWRKKEKKVKKFWLKHAHLNLIQVLRHKGIAPYASPENFYMKLTVNLSL